jgi:hypothetical protein
MLRGNRMGADAVRRPERAVAGNTIGGRLAPVGAAAAELVALEARLAQIHRQVAGLLERASVESPPGLDETSRTLQLAKQASTAMVEAARIEADELLESARAERRDLVRAAREAIAAEGALSDERERALDDAVAEVGAQLMEHRAYLADVDRRLEAIDPDAPAVSEARSDAALSPEQNSQPAASQAALSPAAVFQEAASQDERRSLFGR